MRGIVRRTGSVGRTLGCRRCNGARARTSGSRSHSARRCPQEKPTGAALKTLPNVLLSLREDAELLAGSPLLLERGLAACRRPSDHAFSVADIAKKLFGPKGNPDLASRFVRVTNEKLVNKSMPATIGWTYKKKIALVFLATDLLVGTSGVTGAGTPRIPPVATAADAADRFPERFEQAFARIDREKAWYNFVPIAEIRHALPDYSRTVR